MKVKDPHRAIALEKWEKQNPGLDAEQEGHTVSTVPTKNGPRKCVLLRLNEKDEWDVDFNEEIGVKSRDLVDDGSRTLRAGQQQAQVDALINATIDKVHSSNAKTLESYNADQAKLERMKSFVGEEAGAGDTEQDEDSVKSSVSDDGEDLGIIGDDFISGLVGLEASTRVQGSGKPKSQSQNRPSTGSASMKSSSSAGENFDKKRAAQATPKVDSVEKTPNRQRPSPRSSPEPDSRSRSPRKPSPKGEPICGKGQGKRAKLPVDLEELLKYDGVTAKVIKFDTTMSQLREPQFNALLLNSQEVDAFDKAIQPFCKTLDKAYKEHWAVQAVVRFCSGGLAAFLDCIASFSPLLLWSEFMSGILQCGRYRVDAAAPGPDMDLLVLICGSL